MKRATAVRHLDELAEVASSLSSRLGALDGVQPLRELWVSGDLLDETDEVDHVVVVLMMDVPEEELPSLALHAQAQGWVWSLRLDKRPLLHRFRPAMLPAWDHEQRRVVRFWSADSGADQTAINSLRVRPLLDVPVISPTPSELRDLIARELPRSERHLRRLLDNYWEPQWRRAHRGSGIHPDDHLWRAAEAVMSMREALDELG